MSKYIIQVAPLTNLPVLKTQVYSYLCDRELEPGTLVEVPFYFREIKGIVTKSSKDFPRFGQMKLKDIKNVVEPSFLTEKQLHLAEILAERYLSPLGLFLKSMTPKRIKSRSAKPEKPRAKNIGAVKKSKEADKIAKSPSHIFLLDGPSEKRKEVSDALVKKTLEQKKQVLILTPEIYFAHGVREQMSSRFPREEIAEMHSQIAKGRFYESWKKIKSGEAKIVVASKIGVFLPFSDLSLIILKQEADPSYKQWDMNPRYNAVRVAEELARLFGSKLIFDSSFTSFENFWHSRKGEIQTIKITAKEKRKIKVEIVDLLPEKNKPDFPISQILYKHLADVVKTKGRAIVLVNRRGYSTFTICQNCKKILKCPECDRALVYFEEFEQYRCLHCSHKIELLSACPHCSGFQFAHFGIGIQAVEKKLRKMFPSAGIARLDSDVVKSAKKYKKIHKDVESGSINILVGTQIAVKDAGLPKIDLAGIISAHDFLSLPDFNSREIALSHFREARSLIGKKGIFVIQTFAPNDTLLNYARADKPGKFYESETKMRKKFFYPPYSRMIKLSYRDKSPEKTEKETKKTFDLLRAVGDNKIEIGEPYSPMAFRKRGQFSKNILIKFTPENNLKNLPIYSVLGGLRKGWTVDVDPISTI